MESKSKDWLAGYLAGLEAVDFDPLAGEMEYKHLGGGVTNSLEDAKKEARAAWLKAREVPPCGFDGRFDRMLGRKVRPHSTKATTDDTDFTEEAALLDKATAGLAGKTRKPTT